MAEIYDLVKDRRLYSIAGDASVLEASRSMAEHRVGALPVVENGQLVGIISERDVMTRVVAAGRSPGHTPVRDVMTANPKVVEPGESLENCLFLMKELGFRHLPICQGKELKGLVSLRDIMLKQLAQYQKQRA